VIRNPEKYLKPAFVDEKTGKTFYPNPYYDPHVAQNIMQGGNESSAKYSNDSSNYEYKGYNGL